jgi:hypothetical protein
MVIVEMNERGDAKSLVSAHRNVNAVAFARSKGEALRDPRRI